MKGGEKEKFKKIFFPSPMISVWKLLRRYDGENSKLAMPVLTRGPKKRKQKRRRNDVRNQNYMQNLLMMSTQNDQQTYR